MTDAIKRHWALVALIVVIGFGFRVWLSDHDAKIVAGEEIKFQQHVLDDAKAERDKAINDASAAVEAEKQRSRQLQQQLAAVQVQKQQPATPEQIAEMVAARMNVKAEVKPSSNLPDAPSVVSIDSPKALRDYMLDCDATKLSLASCSGGLQNKDTEINALQGVIAADQRESGALKTQRDAALKRSGFWGKARWGAIGGVLGGGTVAIVTLAHH
jgi:hypothetical protein